MSIKKIKCFKQQIGCQEKARMQDFAPFTTELLEALSDPQTPAVIPPCCVRWETHFASILILL
jgi:hypothetical protein